jgi:hypothetical protein
MPRAVTRRGCTSKSKSTLILESVKRKKTYLFKWVFALDYTPEKSNDGNDEQNMD